MSDSICTVPGCGKPPLARGWCGMHYRRWKRHGNPVAGRRPNGLDIEGLVTWLLKTAITTDTNCLLCMLAPDDSGYPLVTWQNKTHKAKNLVATVRLGPAPSGAHVLHADDCGGDRRCIAQDHLRYGTNNDNVADRERLGRNRPPTGSENGFAKLSETTVIEARRRYAAGASVAVLAEAYGVHRSTIYLALSGQTWRHVPDA